MHVEQELQLILSLSISSSHPTLNSKDLTQEDRQESVGTSPQLPLFYIDIKDIWVLTLLWVDMTASDLT